MWVIDSCKTGFTPGPVKQAEAHETVQFIGLREGGEGFSCRMYKVCDAGLKSQKLK